MLHLLQTVQGPAGTNKAYAGIRIECLFRDFQDAFARGDEAGFMHLLGDAKRNVEVLARLENRVSNDYTDYYERCEAYWNRVYGSGPLVRM